MDPYKPQQRIVPARIFSSAGWLDGKLHVPVKSALADFLGRGHSFLALTDVHFDGSPTVLPFFALRQSETFVVLPHEAEPEDRVTVTVKPHKITCLIPGAVAFGEARLLEGTRMSDLLSRAAGFLTLDNCMIRTRPDLAEERAPWALVNVTRVVGASEMESSKREASGD